MLNWLTRYGFVSAELELDASGTLRESVLDVGCGPHGLSTAAPAATFAGIDVDFHETVAPGMIALRYGPGSLPFLDAAFDTVVCVDVLEHVPPAQRESFVAELARVAGRRVLLACPSDEGAWIDDLVRDAYLERRLPVPDWLAEHDEHGLPTAQEIEGFCSAPAGFRARELAMTNGLLSTMVVVADMLPEFAERAAREWREQRAGWLEVCKTARFGPSHRKGYAIERLSPRDALVDAGGLPSTIWAAVRCPGCGEPALGLAGDALRCASCGRITVRHASGAWNFREAAGPGEATGESNQPRRAGGVTPGPEEAVLLAPARWSRPFDWLPVLSAYIAGVRADRDVVLYLDARDADVEALALRAIIGEACTYLSEGAPFAKIVLLEGTVEVPGGAHAVASVEELVERLDMAGPRVADDPAQVVAHARWAKTLVDAVQAAVDKVRFDATTRIDIRSRPLVTVRIATYGATDTLVDRAIASVLGGAYENVEILVCSDGPQPHARAAVEAITDPRVRYLELEARPDYPAWPECFWRVAGTVAVNRALDEAGGAFIAALDHDDGFTHDHIPKLLEALDQQGGDFIYAQAMTEWPQGDWRLHGTAPMIYGEVIHSTVMYSGRLAHMRYDTDAWLLDQPADWNLWQRIRDTGAGICHLAEPVAVHFKERSSIDHQEQRDADPEAIASDVVGTSARELLRVASRSVRR